VLDLNVSKALETSNIGLLKKSDRIIETERRLHTEFVLKGIESSRTLGHLGRGKGGGTGDKGGKESELHRDLLERIVAAKECIGGS
jgi:hypothetical protein